MAPPDIEWIEFSEGKYVSATRLFNLHGASKIQGKGLPIEKAVRYCMQLSVKYKNLVIPTYEEYTEMLLRVVEGKKKGTEPLASFFKILTRGRWDITRDVIRFNDVVPEKGYKVTLFRFNMTNGKLERVDDIDLPAEGWIEETGKHGYPCATRKGDPYMIGSEKVVIKNKVISDGKKLYNPGGYFTITKAGKPLKKGELHMVQCYPDESGLRLFNTFADEGISCAADTVSALLMRYKD